jgi:6-phosphogluconolactonase
MSATVSTTSQLRHRSSLRGLSILAIAPLLFFAACSSGGDDGGGGGGTPPSNNPPTGSANQFAYVTEAGVSAIRAFTTDGSGNLTPVGTPLFTGNFPHHVDVDPAGRFVYVSNHEAPFLSGYRINQDGSLTPMNPAQSGSPVTGADPTENQSHASIIDNSGQYLYVIAGTGASTLRAYKIDTTPGNTLGMPTFIQGQSFSVGNHAHNITISPNNQFLFVAVEGDDVTTGEVRAFSRNTADGTLTARNTITGLIGATSVKVDPQSKFLYVSYINAVEVLQIAADGSIAKITPTSTFETNPDGNGPHSMAMHPNGQTLYTANINSATVSVFHVDSTTGVLTPLQTAPHPATGGDPNYIYIHPNGQVLFTADTAADQVSRFTINADGTLTATTPIPTATVGDAPNGIGLTNKP